MNQLMNARAELATSQCFAKSTRAIDVDAPIGNRGESDTTTRPWTFPDNLSSATGVTTTISVLSVTIARSKTR